MQIQLPKSQIIKQYKRNGYNVDPISLNHTLSFLSTSKNQIKILKNLIKKINQITINSNQKFGQKIVKIAIQILQQGAENKFKNFDQIVQDVRKWSIMYISPYEINQSKFFIQKPQSSLFKFQPQDVMNNDINRFKQVQEYTKQQLKSSQWFIGVLYEDYSKSSSFSEGNSSKLMLQNQANQIQIVFPQNYQHKVPLVPGCAYCVKGQYMSKNLILTVNQLILPSALPQQKTASLLKRKFKLMCQNINSSKNGLNFESDDFYKYSAIYNQKRDLNNRSIIFGSIKICKQTIQRIFRILTQLGSTVQCVILMLDDVEHDQIDLKIWLKGYNVFIVPHVNCEGPRLLPKIPILKKNFNPTKIVTNPAKFSIYSRQAMFMNLPLMKSLYEKNLLNSKQTKFEVNQQQMANSISELLFSQGSTQICGSIYPKQSYYFKIKQDTVLFISDRACPSMECSKDNKKCTFVSVGNFQRDGHFVCYLPKHKKNIELCQQTRD